MCELYLCVCNQEAYAYKGSTINHLWGRGAKRKKIIRSVVSVNLTKKLKKLFLRFSLKTMFSKKIFLWSILAKKIKIWFGGSPKKNEFVHENQHHAPQMINSPPLTQNTTVTVATG